MEISKKRFNRILREEVAAFFEKHNLTETVDHAGAAEVARAAADLMKALSKFEDKATPAMQNALVQCLPQLKDHLGKMVEIPLSYVNAPEKKVVKLRATKDDKKD